MFTHNGKVYARVSDVLKPFVDFQGISEEVLNRKAALGTRIHDAIHQEIKGELPVVRVEEQGYIHSFYKWRAALEPTFIESEVRYYCDTKMITGCIDALIKLKGEEKAILIDFKTSVQESPVVWPLQGHFYHYLVSKNLHQLSPRILFIKLDRWGALPKVFSYTFDTNLMNRCFQAVDEFWQKQNCCA